MKTESVLSRYFACSPVVAQDDEWVEEELARIEAEIRRGELGRAIQTCEHLRVDMEAHFAFEELVMARTGFALQSRHRSDHDAGLSAVTRLLRDIGGEAAQPQREEAGQRLLERVCELQRRVEQHVAAQDCLVRRHTIDAAGLPFGLW